MEVQGASVTDDYFKSLELQLRKSKTLAKLNEAVISAPFIDPRVPTYFGLGIIGFLIVNPDRMVELVSLTKNEMSRGIFRMSSRPLDKIKIPLDYSNNFVIKALRENHYMITSDWQYLFNPALSAQQARFVQAGGGIACSVVYPLSNIEPRRVLVFSFYEAIQRIGAEHHNFMGRYASLVQRIYLDFEKQK